MANAVPAGTVRGADRDWAARRAMTATGGSDVPAHHRDLIGVPLVLHPLLCAVHPILFLYAHNLTETPFRAVVLPLAVSVGLAGLVWCLTTLVLKSWARAGLIVTALWVAFFSYGHLYHLAERLHLDVLGQVIGPNKVLAPLFIVGLVSAFWIALRRATPVAGTTRVLNVVTACLLAWPVLAIGAHVVSPSPDSTDRWSAGGAADAGARAVDTDRLPNIYYIILDAYARADVLEDVYGYDNTPFIESLKRRGFYVADNSRSNYCRTFLSLSSSLNMQYVTDLGLVLEADATDRKPVIARLQDNRVFRLLRKRGYKIASFASGFGMTEMEHSDRYWSPPWTPGEFQYQLLDTTAVGPLWYGLDTAHRCDAHRRLSLFALANLDRACVPGSPTFVFAHVCLPHPPFVFGPNGELRQRLPSPPASGHDDTAWRRRWRRRYVDQLVFTNRRFQGVIDAILRKADRPTVIILQADHGPRSTVKGEREHVEDRQVPDCVGILNAFYVPGGSAVPWYDDITPVNTFRLLFNHLFATTYPRLPDHSYYSGERHPYKFIDVTDAATKR